MTEVPVGSKGEAPVVGPEDEPGRRYGERSTFLCLKVYIFFIHKIHQ